MIFLIEIIGMTLVHKTIQVSSVQLSSRGKGTLGHCWWKCRLLQPLWKTVRHFFRKLKMDLPLTQWSHFWEYLLTKPSPNSKEYMHPNVHCSVIYKIWKQRVPLNIEKHQESIRIPNLYVPSMIVRNICAWGKNC